MRRLAGAFLSGFGGVSLGAALDKLLKAEDAEEKGAAAVDEGLRETLRSLFFLEPPAEGADLSLGLYLLGVQRSVAGLSALRGGVCPLLRALSAEVRAGGGAVYTDCDLSSILQDASGAARGVSAAGRDLRCSGAVVSALGVSRTLGRLARLPAPSEALRGLRERAPALRVAFLVRNGHRATAQPACAVVCGGEGGEGAFRVDFPCAAGGEDAAEGWSVACVTLALGRGELAAEYAEGLPTLLAPRGGAALREQAVRRARRVLVEQCPEHVGEGGEARRLRGGGAGALHGARARRREVRGAGGGAEAAGRRRGAAAQRQGYRAGLRGGGAARLLALRGQRDGVRHGGEVPAVPHGALRPEGLRGAGVGGGVGGWGSMGGWGWGGGQRNALLFKCRCLSGEGRATGAASRARRAERQLSPL